ncbi:MAG: hypothetical protein ACN6I5_00100 [Hyphomicrobiales bacterium]
MRKAIVLAAALAVGLSSTALAQDSSYRRRELVEFPGRTLENGRSGDQGRA